MISCLRKTISLGNLQRSSSGGQIATLLILMMVVVLIFILVTVNLGQLSVTATKLSNAADSASLYLASQLATKANILWHNLGDKTAICKRSSFLGAILSIIGAVISIATGGIASPVVAGLVGGAIGGFVGGAIVQGTFQGAINGALQGAVIGSAIGGGLTLGGGSTAWTTGGGFPVTQTGLWMGSLAAVGSIYSAVVAERMSSNAFSAAAKALNGLPEEDRFREGTFLQALSQTIDDPKMVKDDPDTDADGDRDELVPRFQIWWDERVKAIKASLLGGLSSIISQFVHGPLSDFAAVAGSQCLEDGNGPFSRQEIESKDGEVVNLLRALGNAGYKVSFWQPGPNKTELQAYEQSPCSEDPDCTDEPPGYDDLDRAMSELDEIYKIVIAGVTDDNGILQPGWKDRDTKYFVENWPTWFDPFYVPQTPENSDSYPYYDSLYGMIYGDKVYDKGGLNAWKDEINKIKDSLPECTYDATGKIEHPPCKWKKDDVWHATISDGTVDEFAVATKKIDNLVVSIQSFRPQIREFYDKMKTTGTSNPQISIPGGKNPVIYEWDDSRGIHNVTVKVGPFKIPSIQKKTHRGFLSKKVCIELTDYSDNGTNAWVQITRQDPANKNTGAMGLWNPSNTGNFSITRTSYASFSYDYVKLKGK